MQSDLLTNACCDFLFGVGNRDGGLGVVILDAVLLVEHVRQSPLVQVVGVDVEQAVRVVLQMVELRWFLKAFILIR